MHSRIALAGIPVLILSLTGFILACAGPPATDEVAAPTAGSCGSIFPSYWQDPDPRFADMWTGQTVSNTPPSDWAGPVFRLSDDYPSSPVDDAAAQPWRGARFDPMFASDTDQATKAALAEEYAWAVMHYIQEGNIDSGDVSTDWTMCENTTRPWFHIPFQTYEVLSSREFVHGLTREAPVTFSVQNPDHPDASLAMASTMWAVGFFNATAAYTLGTVWRPDGTAEVPTEDVRFREGAVVGKLLFNTLTPEQLPVLENMPTWTANISDPSFCNCTSAEPAGPDGKKPKCTMAEESQQCSRSTSAWNPVRLLQFDIAIKDHRAPETHWVYGTFVADGLRKAGESNPWNRISPLGLMWGNDTPPEGSYAHAFPSEPRQNGFAEEAIFWDTVDMLNAVGGATRAQRPGHLGCNSRLNGPADNPSSSCMSCHMTASVPDQNDNTPPIMAQFQGPINVDRTPPGPSGVTFECVDPGTGTDASGSPAEVQNGVPFASSDAIFFANTAAGVPINMTATTPDGPVNVLGDWPRYADGRADWISLDYSLQLSISLNQWLEWLENQQESQPIHDAVLPGR